MTGTVIPFVLGNEETKDIAYAAEQLSSLHRLWKPYILLRYA